MEKILQSKKAYIEALEAKNETNSVQISDNLGIIEEVKKEIAAIENDKFLMGVIAVAHAMPCKGITCGRCKYEGGCHFSTMVEEARRIEKEYASFGYSLRK